MSSNHNDHQTRLSIGLGRVFLILALLQSFAAFISEIQRLSTIGPGFLAKLSLTQIIISLVIILAICIFGGLLLLSYIKPKQVTQRLTQLASWLDHTKTWARIMLLVTIIFLVGCYYITLFPDIKDPLISGVFKRFLPVVLWSTLLCAQTLIFLAYARYGLNITKITPRDKIFYITLAVMGLIFLGWSWVTSTTLALIRKDPRWYNPGEPVIELQLLLAWLAGMGMLLFIVWGTRSRAKSPWNHLIRTPRLDYLVGLCLWIITIMLWQSTPIEHTWFVTEPRPPNFENYPNSDALRYDIPSQTHLVGEGFRNFISDEAYVRRPFLAALFSFLHLTAGQDYKNVVALQIIILALIPSMIYFLATSIHNRISGIMAATLMMMRELNTTNTIRAKQLMSDLPTQFLMVAFTLSTTAWIKRNDRVSIYPLICGGFLGLTTLVRTEAVVLFMPLAIVSGIALIPNKRIAVWFKNTLLFALGTILVLAPWLWRTWKITGYFTIDSPDFYLRFIQRSSQVVNDTSDSPLPSGDIDQNTSGTPPAEINPSKTGSFFQNLPVKLKDGAEYSLSHYLNSQIDTFIILPTTIRAFESAIAFQYQNEGESFWNRCCSFRNYLEYMPYWHGWNGKFPGQAMIPLTLILLTIATGITIAWRRRRLTGLVPLILGVSYMLITAGLRTSGSRFILPADWISLFYFSIGLAQISIQVIRSTTTLKPVEELAPPSSQLQPTAHDAGLFRSPRFYFAVILIFLVGVSLPLFEISIPQRYTAARHTSMLNELMQSKTLDEGTRQMLQTFLSKGGVAFSGRALFPRYFPEGSGEPGSNNAFGPRSYPRIGFYLAGPQSQRLVMPYDREDFSFPNASDVIVFTCVDSTETLESSWEVLAVAVYNHSGSLETVLLRSPMPSSLNCPLPVEISFEQEKIQLEGGSSFLWIGMSRSEHTSVTILQENP